MLSKQEITNIRALLLSDRITYKGNELGALHQVLAALQREEIAARVQPSGQATMQSPAASAGNTPPQE